jgi:hypothetical protein
MRAFWNTATGEHNAWAYGPDVGRKRRHGRNGTSGTEAMIPTPVIAISMVVPGIAAA